MPWLDVAGNVSPLSSNFTLTIDTTPPQTFLDAAPVGTTSSTTATFSFHGTDTLSQAGRGNEELRLRRVRRSVKKDKKWPRQVTS